MDGNKRQEFTNLVNSRILPEGAISDRPAIAQWRRLATPALEILPRMSKTEPPANDLYFDFAFLKFGSFSRGKCIHMPLHRAKQ